MDKETAYNKMIQSGASTYDVANSLYMATVQGISGAKQHGQGFDVSAMAELWNINGTLKNPNASRKIITNRYKGMGVTFEMIQSVINQYPNGIRGYSPSLDELLGITGNQMGNYQESQESYDVDDDIFIKVFVALWVILFIVCKFVFHWGWIVSIFVSLLAGSTIAGLILTKKR